jgi:hypothetical protein
VSLPIGVKLKRKVSFSEFVFWFTEDTRSLWIQKASVNSNRRFRIFLIGLAMNQIAQKIKDPSSHKLTCESILSTIERAAVIMKTGLRNQSEEQT